MGPFSHVTLALNLYFSTFRYFPCTASLQCCHTLNTRKVLSQVPNRTGPTSISKSLTYLFHQWVSINYWRRKMLTLCNCLEVPCEMNSTCYSVWSCLPRCKVGVTSSNFHFPWGSGRQVACARSSRSWLKWWLGEGAQASALHITTLPQTFVSRPSPAVLRSLTLMDQRRLPPQLVCAAQIVPFVSGNSSFCGKPEIGPQHLCFFLRR